MVDIKSKLNFFINRIFSYIITDNYNKKKIYIKLFTFLNKFVKIMN